MSEPLKLLIVEDSPDDAELMVMRLTQDGFQPDWRRVETEAEYLAELEKPTDLILADWSLPKFSGLKAFELVRERNLEIPMVIVSGSIGEEAAIDVLHQGVQDYVLKNRLGRLGMAVQRALENHRNQMQRRRAEAALRESEEKYRILVENAGEAIFILQGGRLAFCNSQTMKLTGYQKGELLFKPFINLVHPEDLALFTASQNPPYRDLPGHAFRIVGNTGEVRWIDLNVVAILWAEEQATLNFMRDITDRKLAELALVESENRYRLLADNTVDVIWTMDLDLTFTYVNPSITDITGYLPEAWIGAKLRDYCDDPNYEKMTQAFQKAFRALPETKGITFDAEMRTRDGQVVPVEITGKIILDEHGEPAALQGVARDITNRLFLENQLRQAQKMESVGRLAGGVAHDFNNMLSVIIGNAQLAMESIPPEHPAHDHLQEVFVAAERSSELTRQLLAYARKQVVRPQVLDLNETVSGMLKMLQRLIGEDVNLIWKPGPNLWPVCVDPSQIDQILANLGVNARDAIVGVGAITIETQNVALDESYGTTHAGFVPGNYVLLAVCDSGMGMDPETLNQIFEPFFTTKPEGQGTGLGLATVYGIVTQNNGFINVYTEPGHGTSFKIYIPAADNVEVESPKSQSTERFHGTETVLLVEDEPAVLSLARAVLERHGYHVLAAQTPAQALKLAADHQGPVHILVTDVIMPEMNGKMLRDKLLAFRPDLKTLFMSGYTANVIAHQGIIEAGINFIQKPFSVQTLTATVREVLDN